MANPFYVPGQQRAERVKALFAHVASRYDLINDLQSFGLHRFWKGRLVKLAQALAGERALDVCCGTGDLALALNKKGAVAVGLDFTEQMLSIAAVRKSKAQSSKSKIPGQRATMEHGCQLQFTQGDAMRLPFRTD